MQSKLTNETNKQNNLKLQADIKRHPLKTEILNQLKNKNNQKTENVNVILY